MENPSEPISDATYFDSLEGIIERSKVSLDHLLCTDILCSLFYTVVTQWLRDLAFV